MYFDCAIIGGGPAGLNAALMLGRARRSVLLIDGNRPRNAAAHASHGFLTRDGVKPSELRRIAHEELARYPSVRRFEREAADVERTAGGFRIHTVQGDRFEARKLIIATGLKESFPAIEGFRDFYGKSLFSCPHCHGWELRDKPLALVSEQPNVFRTAMLVRSWSRDLVVCTNGRALLTAEQLERLHRHGVRVAVGPIAAFYGREGRLEGIRFRDSTTIFREGGFVTPQLSQRSSFGAKLGCAFNKMGGIATDDYGRTSVGGVYAAGDASIVAPSQLVIAAAEGSRAAIGVHTDLAGEVY